MPPSNSGQSNAPPPIRRDEPAYPAELLVLGARAPEEVWLRGTLRPGRRVAVVGARLATAGALVSARAIATALSTTGIAVVSGGAAGVDGAAHRGALDAAGSTVVVLGTGIDVVYPPQHRPLFEEIVARGGALVSQFPPGQRATKWGFPRRNALIAALAETVVVVEAGTASGALHTASAAHHLGRRTIVLAGSPGCDALAGRGLAEEASDLDDLIARLIDPASAASVASAALATQRAWPPPARAPAPPPVEIQDPRARQLYEALDRTPRDLSELAVRSGLPAAEAMALVIDLEVDGLVARAAGGRYQRAT